jgi:hypothetical protein
VRAGAATATIAGGQAQVKAMANNTLGTYLVRASATGAVETGIALTNTEKRGLEIRTTADVVDATDGLTSPREAIDYADSHPGPDTIVLGPGLLETRKQTIRLTGSPLVLTDPATTTIIGPGANLLTLSGGGKSRVCDIEGDVLPAGDEFGLQLVLPGDLGLAPQAGENFEDDLGLELRREGSASALGHRGTVRGWPVLTIVLVQSQGRTPQDVLTV